MPKPLLSRFVERLKKKRQAEEGERGFPAEEKEFETLQPFFGKRKKKKKAK